METGFGCCSRWPRGWESMLKPKIVIVTPLFPPDLGRPAEYVHALQMEIALSAYLDDEAAPWAFAPAKAASLQATLAAMIEAALAAATQLERTTS